MTHSILIADDDPTQRRLLEGLVQSFGYRVKTAATGDEVVSAALAGDSDVALVLLDVAMPGKDGLEVLRELRPVRPTLPVIVLTAQGGIDMVISAMKAGADDFIVKPVGPERLQVSIQNALKLNALTGEVTRLSRRVNGTLTFEDLIAKSPAMQQVVRLGQRAAKLANSHSHRGRERRRQGARRARDPRRERARGQAFRHRQLRRDPREPGREHSLRP